MLTCVIHQNVVTCQTLDKWLLLNKNTRKFDCHSVNGDKQLALYYIADTAIINNTPADARLAFSSGSLISWTADTISKRLAAGS